MNCHKPETNELETAREPDTTSQTGRQVKCHEGGQMNWSQPKSWTPPARLGNKWIVGKTQTPPARLGDKSIRDSQRAGHHQRDWDSRRAGHHQPDWETNELPQGKTNELETAKAGHHQPDWEKMSCHKSQAGNKWIGDSQRAGHHQPDWETSEVSRGGTDELEPAEKLDTSSQIGKQMSCHKGRQMNWRQPKSRTPPARLGNKWVDIRANKWVGDSQRAGHHQPDWETNELPQGDKWIRDIRRARHHHLNIAGHRLKENWERQQ